MVCVAQNDALLEGLLTLIHKEREAEFHMSSTQVCCSCTASAAGLHMSSLQACCSCTAALRALPGSQALQLACALPCGAGAVWGTLCPACCSRGPQASLSRALRSGPSLTACSQRHPQGLLNLCARLQTLLLSCPAILQTVLRPPRALSGDCSCRHGSARSLARGQPPAKGDAETAPRAVWPALTARQLRWHTRFHASQCSLQARMPFQSDYDKAAIRELAAEAEIDYVALTYTCSAQDVSDLRGFLDSSGLQHTAIMAKVGGPEQQHGTALCLTQACTRLSCAVASCVTALVLCQGCWGVRLHFLTDLQPC